MSIYESTEIVTSKLKYGILAVRLRKLKFYLAVRENMMRSSSTFSAVQRYIILRFFIAALDKFQIDDLELTAKKERKINDIELKVKEPCDATKKLQIDSC